MRPGCYGGDRIELGHRGSTVASPPAESRETMTEATRGVLERRCHTRIIAKGAVSILAPGYAQRGRIADVGAGGMFVVTPTSTPERLLHRAVELQIRLDVSHAEWLPAMGEVVRIAANGIGVAFAALPLALLGMLDRLSTAARASARVMSVVLIDAVGTRRSAMAAGFRATGCSVVEAATPLEAVVRLGEAMFEPDVIAVADSQSSAAAEMRVFVAREHPGIKMVTIGDELFAPDGISHWLSATTSYVDLPHRIREVLVRPRSLHA